MANVQDYLLKLLEKANKHCFGGVSETVLHLYRNKPSAYFDDIQSNKGNLMEKYLKDNGGDPYCPLNGRLEGLFFGVTLRGGALPQMSPFGDTRVILPLHSVFDDSAKLYFADFFCMPVGANTHYVVLVITKDGSESDRFCEQELIKLDPYNNRFLSKHGGRYQTLSRQGLWVEVFYTEHVDISSLLLTRTGVLGHGQSVGGIAKDPTCPICNVEPETRKDHQNDLHGVGVRRDLMMRPQQTLYQGGQVRMSKSTCQGEGDMRQMEVNQWDLGYRTGDLVGKGYNGSNHMSISYEGSKRRGMGYRGPFQREMDYETSNHRDVGYGQSNPWDVGYGGPIPRDVVYGPPHNWDVGYAQPNHWGVGYGQPNHWGVGYGRTNHWVDGYGQLNH
ncbi:phytanoyl-CoA hydroxylase-interacting protein-like [Haliotis asinina]|uniref:phytanoyl-CoA hydroxylase-interacting protein-like n=1 Tax=Haliotis asinina TaxID=109174 RepID=UPI003531A2F5